MFQTIEIYTRTAEIDCRVASRSQFVSNLFELGSMPPTYLSKILIAAFVVVALGTMPVAFSQDSANSDITLVKEDRVQISDIDDWDFGSFAVHDVANSQERLTDTACVFSTTGRYSLTVGGQSQGGGNRMRLRNANGEGIRYVVDVRYSNGSGNTTRRVNINGTTINNMTGSLSLGCTDVNSSNLQFTAIVVRVDFNRASPGTYRDVVTLLVSPE